MGIFLDLDRYWSQNVSDMIHETERKVQRPGLTPVSRLAWKDYASAMISLQFNYFLPTLNSLFRAAG